MNNDSDFLNQCISFKEPEKEEDIEPSSITIIMHFPVIDFWELGLT